MNDDSETRLIYEATKSFQEAEHPCDLDEEWRRIVAPLYDQQDAMAQEILSAAYNKRLDELL